MSDRGTGRAVVLELQRVSKVYGQGARENAR